MSNLRDRVREYVDQYYGGLHEVDDETDDLLQFIRKEIEPYKEALHPFVEAYQRFEGECLFGGLGTPEAGVYFPDKTEFALAHVTEPDAEGNQFGRLRGSEDDVGVFTLGDLRKAEALICEDEEDATDS